MLNEEKRNLAVKLAAVRKRLAMLYFRLRGLRDNAAHILSARFSKKLDAMVIGEHGKKLKSLLDRVNDIHERVGADDDDACAVSAFAAEFHALRPELDELLEYFSKFEEELVAEITKIKNELARREGK